MIHSLAWLAWAGAILAAASSTRNPLYLALLILVTVVVQATSRPAEGTPPLPLSPWRFGLVVILLSMLFNGLTVHAGRTVLFELPRRLPILGGPITLEAITYGALNGAVLTTIFAAFTVLNRALPVRALVRLIPRAFYPLAVVVSIAVTFVPATLRQFQQIREAQAVRGHRLRGWRDWLPLFLPLLIGGLERSLQLAEAMTARGFAGGQNQRHRTITRLAIILGMGLVLGGWLLRLAWSRPGLGTALLLVGLVLIGGTIWQIGRGVKHTVYRPETWRAGDWGVLLGAALAATAYLLPLPILDRSSIFYYPYPALSLPGFNPLLGLATLGLLGPLVFGPRSVAEREIPAKPSPGPAKRPSGGD